MAIMNNSKEVTRGDTGLFSIALFDADGDPYVPDPNDVLTFYLLDKDCDELSDAVLTKVIPTNTMQLELLPSETAALSIKTYAYRIRIKDTFNHEWTVVKSKLKVIC